MEYRRLGSSDLKVSEIGFGAWGIGGAPFWKTEGDKNSLDSIKKAYVLTAFIMLICIGLIYRIKRKKEPTKQIEYRTGKNSRSTECQWWLSSSLFFDSIRYLISTNSTKFEETVDQFGTLVSGIKPFQISFTLDGSFP